jgi:hypothetical protein
MLAPAPDRHARDDTPLLDERAVGVLLLAAGDELLDDDLSGAVHVDGLAHHVRQVARGVGRHALTPVA